MFYVVSVHAFRCVRRCAVRCPPRARDQRIFQVGLSEAPRPFIYKTQISRNLAVSVTIGHDQLAIRYNNT